MRIYRAISAIVLLAAVLGGCGGPMIFAKDGAGQPELQKDQYDCQQQWEQGAQATAFRRDPVANVYYGVHARAEIQGCLERLGWTRTN